MLDSILQKKGPRLLRGFYCTYTSLSSWFGIGSVSALVNRGRNGIGSGVGSVGKDADVFLT